MKPIQTRSGDLMQVSECKDKGVTYGLISILLKEHYTDIGEAEKLLVTFIQQMQPIFAVQHTTDYDVLFEAQQQQTSVIAYWQDIEAQDWKVKGWTNGKKIEVTYIRNISLTSVL